MPARKLLLLMAPLLAGASGELRGEATHALEAADSPQNGCAEYLLKVCCGSNDLDADAALLEGEQCSESMTTLKSPNEVRAADVCGKQCPGKSCEWSWRAEGCSGGTNSNNGNGTTRKSIQCTKPRASRVRSEGQAAVCASLGAKDVPYTCEDGSELCCTDSELTEVTFKDKDWGKCTKVSEPEVEASTFDNEAEDPHARKNPLDERARRCMFQCTAEGRVKSECRAECTGQERAVGPGKMVSTGPTPAPPSRKRVFCMQECRKTNRSDRSKRACERKCPKDEGYAFE